jgi:lipoprotein-releasing system permease protein
LYKSLLIFKYLRKRRIAWVSLVAVMLCTAMVLVVISVMGGWLTMFKAKFRGMSGDIVVYRGNVTGFGGYKEMLAEIRKLPEVAGATPLIHSFGLLNINNRDSVAVAVTGLNLDEYGAFNQFGESLLRQNQVPRQSGQPPATNPSFGLLPDVPYEAYRSWDKQARQRPGMIVGGPIFGVRNNKDGKAVVPDWLFTTWCQLDVVPLTDETRSLTRVTPTSTAYWVVDVSRTKLFQLDERVYVPFDVLQKDLKMDERDYEEEIDGKLVQFKTAARCNEIQVNLNPGVDRMAMVETISGIVRRISRAVEPGSDFYQPIKIEPWEKKQEKFLGAVENEKSLLTFLLGLISLVAIFLIFCILYMIVVEKTRDIGIIKSVGATSQGIAAIFLGYGLAIGVVGGLSGLAVGWAVMTWINEIHTGIAVLIGRPIWDPEIYAFDKIPDKVEPFTAAIVVAVAVLSAVIGAVVPAVRAARLNPVEALRFE